MTIVFRNILIKKYYTKVFSLQDNVSVKNDKRELAKLFNLQDKRELVKEDADDTRQTREDMYRNWIILMTVNTAFIDFFQNWFWYFRRHRLTVPVIVIAEDFNFILFLLSLHEVKT